MKKRGKNKKDLLLPQRIPCDGKKVALFRHILAPMAETSSDEGKQTQNWAHAAILKGKRLMARLGARKYLDGLVWKCFFLGILSKIGFWPFGA